MIYSMTGYGRAVAMYQDKKICVEVRSLNGKAMDLSTRMAQQFKGHEMEVRSYLTAMLERGKVDFALWVEQNGKDETPSVNKDVMRCYIEQLHEASQQLNISLPQNIMEVVLRMPDVISRKETYEVSDEEWAVAKEAMERAVSDLLSFRKQEGEALYAKFRTKIDNIAQLLATVEQYETERVAKIKSRIVDNLEKLVGIDYDRNRLEQELIFYIEKLDVSEEKQRLANHLEYFCKMQ